MLTDAINSVSLLHSTSKVFKLTIHQNKFKMNKSTLKHIALALVVLLGFDVNAQTLKVPAPSPLQTVKQAFALSEITIEYSRPSSKGRIVYGDLVPFGKVWRTGANAASKITFGENVKVEGKDVPAGTYALYTIPGKDSWDILIYKDLKLGGDVANYKNEDELTRFKVKTANLNDKVETFTINVANITSKSASIELSWENTRVSFGVEADIDAAIMKNIDTALEKDNRPYHQSASYYFDNNKDLNKALEWSTKAVENNPKAYWMLLLKAKIQLKLNDKKGATASAQKVVELAKEAQNDDYVKMAEKLISEAK
jgi:hypothetical protein